MDPDGVLSPAERARRAGHARKAYVTRLALRSAQARRKTPTVDDANDRSGRPAEDQPREPLTSRSDRTPGPAVRRTQGASHEDRPVDQAAHPPEQGQPIWSDVRPRSSVARPAPRINGVHGQDGHEIATEMGSRPHPPGPP